MAALLGVAGCAMSGTGGPRGRDIVLPETFVIGPASGDPHSHAAFPGVPNDVVKVSSRLRITRAIDHGLNFFAIQVNFPNRTWAHGGLQLVDGGRYQMNWGGLVNRGGGSADYQKEDPASDLTQMQNGPDRERSARYDWAVGKEYILTIERGKQIDFPPGNYVFIGSGPSVPVPNQRVLWEWKFTLAPADGTGPIQISTLYDAADRIASFYLWNECGYGSCGQGQSATWSMPVYARLGAANEEIQTRTLKRF
ncbi:hypothetical protein [Solilutibacter silvestris]|uniref:Uncharacterized protein n=1 Tax=Solilutibacter silvestris TaxID=1645665 RepID=A0A2K1Q454_9GAMM|nr:hypothetical protein [Lysobacter silvestris]PNS09819.1 hypothetical protein Lysil_1448 [Lysobacter silvestris]